MSYPYEPSGSKYGALFFLSDREKKFFYGRDGKHRFCAPRVYKNRLLGGEASTDFVSPGTQKSLVRGYP